MATSNSQSVSQNFGLKNSLILKNTKLFECGICMNIMYNASSCVPCLHSFCAGCVGKWLKDNKSCPMCRSPASDLLTNRILIELIENFVAQNPERQRTDEDKTRLDTCEIEYLRSALNQALKTLEPFLQQTESIADLMRIHVEKVQRIQAQATARIATFTSADPALIDSAPDVPAPTDTTPIVPVLTDPVPIAPVLTDPAPIAPALTDPAPTASLNDRENPRPETPRINRRRRPRSEVDEEEVVPRRSARLRKGI